MSSASLAHARHTQHHSNRPDSIRIAALSAAIALNLAVLLIATRPMSAPPLVTAAQTEPAQLLRLITPPAAIPPPPAIVLKPRLHPPRTVSHSQPRTQPLVVPVTEAATQPRTIAEPALSPRIEPSHATPDNTVTAAPVEASLAYLSAPLQFPAQAMRQQMHGTVLLRVLVDETGKPLDVLIERSSGYTLLDRSAREQVLASWKFQPAIINGKAARAWARVPVSFDLHQQ